MFVSQTIHRPQGVNVFGSCLIRVEPDYASLRFSVVTIAEKPKDAIAAAQRAARDVRGVLGAAQVAERDVRASRVTLQLAYEGFNEKRREIGYRAEIAFQVLVRELERVEQLLVDIVDAGARVIGSVSYKSSDLKQLRARAREGAIAAARAKAEVYAGALGQQVGKALHVEDVDPENAGRRSHTPDFDLSEGETEAGELAAGSIVVAGAVMVCFALL